MTGVRKYARAVCALGLMALVSQTQAAFISGHVAVLRLGDGSGAINSNAQALYLDEYDVLSGGLVASHAIPSSGGGALTLGGRGEHDGHLNLSSNGQYITLGGYRADAGASDPVSGNARRVIGRVDSNWNVDTTTTLEEGAYYSTHLTAVASDNGQRFWTAGDGKYTNPNDLPNNFQTPTTSGGLRYVNSLGASSSTNVGHVQTITYDNTGKAIGAWPDSIRNTRIYGGQLYVTTPAKESFVNRGAYKTGDALPTTGPQTMLGVINNVEGQAPDPTGKFVPKSDLVMLDLDPNVPGFDTAYGTGGKDDYQKWSLVNGVWSLLSTQLLPSKQEINALDALVTGNSVTLLASTDQGIYKLVDTAGYNAIFSSAFSLSPFIAAGANTEFRGLALVPEPMSVLMLALGAAALGARRRR